MIYIFYTLYYTYNFIELFSKLPYEIKVEIITMYISLNLKSELHYLITPTKKNDFFIYI